MNTTTLHIPLDTEVRKKFTAKAKELGFDSAQAYVRVLIKAAADDRQVDFDVWSNPSPAAVKRLTKAADDARKNEGLTGPFTSVEDFMKEL